MGVSDLGPLGGAGFTGPLVTRTLLFLGVNDRRGGGDPVLNAFDKATGEIVGSVDLPGGALGTPMTYMLDGRQYIAVTVGGRAPQLVAFVLPS